MSDELDFNHIEEFKQEFEDRVRTLFLKKLNPESVIYFETWIDVYYDRPSENMGSFFQVVYLKNGKPRTVWGNPGEYEFIANFLKRAKKVLTDKNDYGTGQQYYNPKFKADIKWKGDVLVYKDRYAFKMNH